MVLLILKVVDPPSPSLSTCLAEPAAYGLVGNQLTVACLTAWLHVGD